MNQIHDFSDRMLGHVLGFTFDALEWVITFTWPIMLLLGIAVCCKALWLKLKATARG